MKKLFENTNYNAVEEKLTQYISDITSHKKVLVGLSGGIDSSLTCVLAKKAVGAQNVKALIMSNTRFSKQNLESAKNFALTLGIAYTEVNSTYMREGLISALELNDQDIIQSASADARICDVILKTLAAKEDRIYLGTINGTERLTGWYPKGTLVGDFCPLGGLLKGQIGYLAMHLGLSSLVETISHEGNRICSGCGVLPDFKGISYETLDRVLYLYETSSKTDLQQQLYEAGIEKSTSEKILKRVHAVEHKSDVFPTYCKINLEKGKP